MLRRWAAVVAVSAIALTPANPAGAAGALDQANTPPPGGIGSSYVLFDPVLLAQTFTPAASGALDQVDVLVGRDPLAAKPFVLQVRTVAGGRPGTEILASATVPSDTITLLDHVWVSVPLARSVSTAGTRFAIVLSAPGVGLGGNYYWFQPAAPAGEDPDRYTPGEGFRSGDGTTWDGPYAAADFAFRTYVLSHPETTISAGPPASTTSSDATFAFSSTRPAARFECRLDSVTWQSCSSPVAYATLAPGAHTFAVRAIDDPLLADPSPAEQSWTITTPPAAPTTTPTAKPLTRTRVLDGARLRLVIPAGSACVSAPALSVQVTGTRLHAPFVRITRVQITLGDRTAVDRRAPFEQRLRLPASLRPGRTTTLVARITLRLTRKRTAETTMKATVRRCA